MQTLHFQSIVSDSEPINDMLTRVKIHVAYEGLNRNNSFISRDTFDKASPTAKYCPIIGEWSRSIDDFKDHGGKIEIEDDEIRFVNTTTAYGLIGDEEPYWESVEQPDGTFKDYYTVIGYLWTGRFPELEGFNLKSQSMEILINNGKFQEIDNDKVYVIEDMVFSGFCILGDDVEPCFEDSTISTYSFNKDEFKKQFNQMIKELKYSLEKEETSNSTDTNIMSEFDVKGGKDMPEGNEPKKEEFALSSEQVESELRRELAKSQTVDDWGYACQDYYLVDFLPDQNIVIAQNWNLGYLVGLNYMVNGDVVTVDLESAMRYKVEYVPMNADLESDDDNFSLTSKEYTEYQLNVKEKEVESKLKTEYDAKIEAYESDLSTLKEEFEVIKQEKEELETFKLDKIKEEKEEQINEVFEKFSDENFTEEELSPIKEQAFELTLEELEDKLFALAGRKKVKFSAKKEKDRINMGLNIVEKPEEKVVNDIWAEQKLKFSQGK